MTSNLRILGEDKTLFFLHIPKTAGISFNYILTDHFKQEEIYPFPTAPEFLHRKFPVQFMRDFSLAYERFSPEVIKDYRLVMGHWDYSIVSLAPWLTPITIIRQPAARVFSWYKHIKRHIGIHKSIHDKINEQRMSIADSVRDDEIREHGWIVNHQTRQIAGFARTDRAVNRPPDNELLEIAKSNLSKFPFFGLTERMLPSMWLLSYTFGWQPISNIPVENADPEQSSVSHLSHADVEAVQEIVQLDLQLYAYAEDLFNKRVGDAISQMILARSEQNTPIEIRSPIVSHHKDALATAVKKTNKPLKYLLDDGHTLFFSHINKTAGITVCDILSRYFDKDEIYPVPLPNATLGNFPINDVADIRDATIWFDLAKARKCKLIMGHFDFGIRLQAPWLLPFTLLRDPIQRFISEYQHIVRYHDEPWIVNVWGDTSTWTVEDYLSNEKLKQGVKNTQTRFMAGFVFSRSPQYVPDNVLLELAMQNLNDYILVGFTERLWESMWLLTFLMGWKPVLDMPHLNRAAEKIDLATIAPSTLVAIQELNQLDITLYEYAKQRFDQQFAQMMDELLEQNTLRETYIHTPQLDHTFYNAHQEMLVSALSEHSFENSEGITQEKAAENITEKEYPTVWKHPRFDPTVFAVKASLFERQFDAQEFQQLAKVLGNRFQPNVQPSIEEVLKDYPHYDRLLIDNPAFDSFIERYLPQLMPFTQAPFPLPAKDVIHGPWLGNYKTANFPLCDVNMKTVAEKRVIDIGCNAGFDSFYLASLGASEVVGIEPSAFCFQAMFLWTLYYCPNLRFMKTRWQDLSRDVLGTFDLVNCQGILYHEPDPMQLLLALQRLLAPGGKLVLETHITMEDDMNARFIEGNFWGDPNWWWLPSSDTMMAMLRTCGFEDVQLRAKYPVPSQNPNNEHLTVEGVPVGGRAFFTATQPQNPSASRKVRFSLGGRDR